MISLVNGKFTDKLSIFDRGLAYGDGFFETMRWKLSFDKEMLLVEFWNRHIERLRKGCEQIKINFPEKKILDKYKSKLIKKVREIKMQSGVLKVIITRGSGGRGYKYENGMVPNIIFIITTLPNLDKTLYQKGVKIKICKSKISRNPDLAGLKHLNRLDSVMARSEWNDNEIFEGLILDDNENVLEGTMSNIFSLKSGVLRTPIIKESGIRGVMRDIIIDKFSSEFNVIHETILNLDELMCSDSIFITNSIIKVLPVSLIEKKRFDVNEKVKILTKKLSKDIFLELN